MGKPGPGAGELPVAFVKLKKGMSADIAGMLNHVNNQVAHYKKLGRPSSPMICTPVDRERSSKDDLRKGFKGINDTRHGGRNGDPGKAQHLHEIIPHSRCRHKIGGQKGKGHPKSTVGEFRSMMSKNWRYVILRLCTVQRSDETVFFPKVYKMKYAPTSSKARWRRISVPYP